MGTADRRMQDRINALERRIARLESAVLARTSPAGPDAAPSAPPDPEPTHPIAPPPERPTAAARPKPRILEEQKPAKPQLSLESFIGGRAFAVLGAIAVVVAVGLFLKLAWDQGWLRMSPEWRCIAAGIFGAVMLAAGEWSRKRFAPWAVAGVMSVGVGALLAAPYAAFALYDLITRPAAFAMLVAVCALGSLLGARARLFPVALLSVLAAYAAPILLNTPNAPPAAMPVYLIAIHLFGLALSLRDGRWFGAMPGVVAWGSALLGGMWGLEHGPDHTTLVLGFAAAIWVIHHADAISRARADRVDRDSRTRAARWSRARWGRRAAGAISIGAWAALLGVAALGDGGNAWAWPATLAALSVLLAAALDGGLRALREPPGSARLAMSLALLVQAGAGIVVSIALALDWPATSITWLALGAASSIAAVRLRSAPLRHYASIALALGAIAAILLAETIDTPTTVRLGIGLSRWTALMAGAAAAWLLHARLLLTGDVDAWRTWFARVAAFIGVALACITLLNPQTTNESLVWAWLTVAAAVLASHAIEPRLWLRQISLVALLATLGAWIWAWFGHRSWGDEAATPGLHPGLLQALAGASIAAGAGWWIRATGGGAPSRIVSALAFAGALAMTFITTSLEVARSADVLLVDATAQSAAVSLWWALFGVALLIAGFARRWTPIRQAGLVALLAALFKAGVVDLWEIEPLWRVVSLLGVGLLMLAVALGYSRLAIAMKGDQRRTSEEAV